LATAEPDHSDEEDQFYDSEDEQTAEEHVDVELEEDAAAFEIQDGSHVGYIDANGLQLGLIQVKARRAHNCYRSMQLISELRAQYPGS